MPSGVKKPQSIASPVAITAFDRRLICPRHIWLWSGDCQRRRMASAVICWLPDYDRFLRYLTGCADFFRRGITDVGQFTLTKQDNGGGGGV